MNKLKAYFVNIVFALIGFLFISFTVVSKAEKQLFNIERSKDSNEIIYELNFNSDNTLNFSEPVKAYWVKHDKNNKVEPLTWIQKNYAYGLEFISVKKDLVLFQFVSYNRRTFILKKNQQNEYKVYTNSNGKEVEVRKIFIQIDGGTFWLPNVTRIELYGYDYRNNKQIVETVNP